MKNVRLQNRTKLLVVALIGGVMLALVGGLRTFSQDVYTTPASLSPKGPVLVLQDKKSDVGGLCYTVFIRPGDFIQYWGWPYVYLVDGRSLPEEYHCEIDYNYGVGFYPLAFLLNTLLFGVLTGCGYLGYNILRNEWKKGEKK